MAGLLLLLCSCSNKEDERQLLETIPADAEMVTLINLHDIIKETGAGISGDKLTLPDAYKTLAAQGKGSVPDLLMQGGVKLTYAAAFTANGITYLSGFVADQEAFRAYIEQTTRQKFAAKGKVQVCESVVIDGDRFWYSQPGHETDIETFAATDADNSIAVSAIGKILLEEADDKAFCGFTTTSTLTKSNVGNHNAMILAMMFGNVKYVTFEADIDEHGVEMDGKLLDSTLKPVENTGFFTRIDEKVLASLFGKGDMFMVIGIEPKKMSALAGLFSAQDSKAVNSFQGTFALAVSTSEMTKRGIPAFSFAATLKPTADTKSLPEMVRKLGISGIDGIVIDNTLLINTDPIPAASATLLHLDEFKDAYIGIALGREAMEQFASGTAHGWLGAYFKVKPKKGSYEIEGEVYSESPEQTLLLLLTPKGWF